MTDRDGGVVGLRDAIDPRAVALCERHPGRESAVRRSGELFTLSGRVDPTNVSRRRTVRS